MKLRIEIRIDTHAGRAETAHEAPQGLLDLPPAAFARLHLAQGVAVFLFPVGGVGHELSLKGIGLTAINRLTRLNL